LFVNYFASLLQKREIVVVSPDTGGVKRVEDFRQAFSKALAREVNSAFIEKYRSGGVVSGQAVIGDVAGKAAVIMDDLISSGTTLARAAEACRVRGAISVYAAATHGVFSSKANESLANPAFDQIAITNSVSSSGLDSNRIRDRLTVLDVTGLFAEAIERIHSGGSIVDLLES
jgi:ribose-phosphate pyrophosphokinase